MDLQSQPTWSEIAIISAVVACASFGLLQVIKGFLKPIRKKYRIKKNDAWWYDAMVRALALVIGGSMGHMLLVNEYGWLIGIGAGAMNSIIYKTVSRRVKNA